MVREAAAEGPDIEDSHTLLRRVHRSHTASDGAGGVRLASNFINDLTDDHGITAMSMHVQELLEAAGLTAYDLLVGYESFGLAAIRVDVVRASGLLVVLAPEPHDGPRGGAHVNVLGKKTGSIQKRLMASATVLRWPAA